MINTSSNCVLVDNTVAIAIAKRTEFTPWMPAIAGMTAFLPARK
jgi:hypothetical protein